VISPAHLSYPFPQTLFFFFLGFMESVFGSSSLAFLTGSSLHDWPVYIGVGWNGSNRTKSEQVTGFLFSFFFFPFCILHLFFLFSFIECFI
jgi:hypothetical protein